MEANELHLNLFH